VGQWIVWFKPSLKLLLLVWIHRYHDVQLANNFLASRLENSKEILHHSTLRLWQHPDEFQQLFIKAIYQYISCYISAGSEVPTAMAMKSIVFWDTTPCSRLKVNRRFGGTCRKLCLLLTPCWFHALPNLRPWAWRRHVPPKRRLTFKILYCFISHKAEILISHFS
jgi:hypothetical protein